MEGLLLFALGLAGLAAVAWRPEWTAPFFAFFVYMRWSDALRGEFGVPSLFMLAAPALLVLAVGRWLFQGRSVGAAWRPALLVTLGYGAVCIASLLYAIDTERTVDALMNQLDGFFIVLVMALALRTPRDFERTLGAILAAGAVLGGLTVLQQATGAFDERFAGFAKAELRAIYDESAGYRSAGPVSANYFGLVLVTVVPIAVHWLVHARARRQRLLGGATLGLVLASIALTYSRGAVLTLAVVALAMGIWVPRRRLGRLVGVTLLVGVVAVAAVAPTEYGRRLAALTEVVGATQGHKPQDSALRGRLSEVTSAALMFGDHPLLGVGLGNYEVYYHRYARDLALDGRREERQAHSLYLEVAAETGLLGVTAFGGMLVYLLQGIRRARGRLMPERRLEAEHATAFGIALLGYLAGSCFLHLSYPRYFWLLIGIALGVRGLYGERSSARRPALPEPLLVGSEA